MQEQRILEEIDEVREPDESRRADQIVLVQADVERLQHGEEAEEDDDGQRREENGIPEERLLGRQAEAEPPADRRWADGREVVQTSLPGADEPRRNCPAGLVA